MARRSTSRSRSRLPVVRDGLGGPALAVLSLVLVTLTWACSSHSNSTDSAGWATAERVDSSDLGSVAGIEAMVSSSGNLLVVWQQSNGAQLDLWSARYFRTTGWNTPERIETQDLGDARTASLIADADGNAMAIWRQHDGNRYDQWANRFSASAGWGTPTKIDSEDLGDVQPRVAVVSDAGDWTAVWRQNDGVRYNQWANTYDAVTGWGTPEKIDSEDLGDVFDAKIAVAPSGVICAVWRQYDGVRWNLWANRYRPELGWDGDQKIEISDIADVSTCELVVDADGYFTVVWVQGDGTRTNLWANRLSPSGVWAGSSLIESSNDGDVSPPEMRVDSMGDVTVIWAQSDGTRLNLWSQRRDFSTGWQGAELRESEDLGSVVDWTLFVDDSDNVIALWTQSDGTVDNLWAARYRPGVGWSTAEEIEDEDGGSAILVERGVFDAQNHFTVAFQVSDGTRRNLWANRFDPATGWEGAVLIETENAGDTRDPDLVEHQGVVTVVWRQDGGTQFDQWSARFDPDEAGSNFAHGWTAAEKIEQSDAGSVQARTLVIDSAGRVTALWPQSDGTFDQLWANRLE